MSGMSEKQRDELSDDQFAYVSGDERKLPIHDEDHVRNAVQRFGQTDFDSAADKRTAAKKVLAAARDQGIEISDDDDVVKAAKG